MLMVTAAGVVVISMSWNQPGRRRWSGHRGWWILLTLLLGLVNLLRAQDDIDCEDCILQPQQYIIVGVSGGLQAGFPDHKNLDFHAGQEDEVQAVFLGRALVRGYKSYLDVMEEDWRQYTPEPGQPLINCNVVPTGCYEHANQYWMYLVDTRQFITILMKEPRFLSIAPDLGLVDLTVPETSAAVKHIVQHQVSTRPEQKSKTNIDYAAFPIVTAAWSNPTSHVESPILYTMEDGTEVTNFAESLATWAGVIGPDDDQASCSTSDSESFTFLDEDHQEAFWKAIRKSVRAAEANRPTFDEDSPVPPFECRKQARFGVSKDMPQINYPLTRSEFSELMLQGSYEVNFTSATLTRR
mmetsp:Transcript_62900/g.180965  ORF Transcript_62900/g.180965 Transcript_62900/m.180965 type:complete len:354 (-) Transcript_62900:113-1174(-)